VPALVEIHGVVKSYLSQSLRPLRIREFTVSANDRLTLRGFDAGAAEMFVHLVTVRPCRTRERCGLPARTRATSPPTPNGSNRSIASASSRIGPC
jgi:hypothetical protein